MAPPPRKRSPRPSAAKTPQTASEGPNRATSGDPSTPSLVDPETVAAVRRTTARAVHAVVTTSQTVAGACARGAVAAAQWAGPRCVRAGEATARATWAGLAATARWTWDCRRGLARLTQRGLWWGALAILILVGRALLSADGDPELVEVAVLWFGAGLSMSVLVLLSAPETRMRVAAGALAGGHGSLAALAWVALGAS